MASKKNHFYVVWQGKVPGIYDSWSICEKQVKGHAGAIYKGFTTRVEAEQAYASSADAYIIRKSVSRKTKEDKVIVPSSPILPSLAVDAACSGNPGIMEFRGVITDVGTEVFHRGPYRCGTNNIGEFLAIVLGLAYLKQNNLSWALYSDSRTALAWLRKKHAETKLEWNALNQDLFYALRKAEQWLQNNTYTTSVYKWDTKRWGEIPADFGRK